jgi:hypothetical protein
MSLSGSTVSVRRRSKQAAVVLAYLSDFHLVGALLGAGSPDLFR